MSAADLRRWCACGGGRRNAVHAKVAARLDGREGPGLEDVSGDVGSVEHAGRMYDGGRVPTHRRALARQCVTEHGLLARSGQSSSKGGGRLYQDRA